MTSEWRTVSLGECAELDLGHPFKSADYTDSDDGIRLLRGDNIGQGQLRWDGVRRWLRKEGDKLTTYLLRENDLVLAMDRPWITAGLKFARVRHGDLPSLLVQRVARIRPKAGVDADYLHSVIASSDFTQHIQTITTGTAVPHISGKQIQEYKFNIPDIVTQRSVGSLLMAFDDRITLLRETNATLEAIAQALFKSWFVDFDPVRAKMEGCAPDGMDEATAALFPDGFEESELGLVPRGWQVLPVAEVAEIVKGKSYSSKDLVEMHDTALVTLKSFARGGGFRLDGFKPYSGAYKASQVVVSGDLIVAYTDVTQAAELIGKPAIVIGVDEHKTLIASLDVGIIRPLTAKVSRQFLYGLFNTDAFQAHTLSHTSGTTVLHLSKDGVGSYRFVCSPISVVEAFSVIAESLTSRQQVNIDQMRNLATLRDTLLPRLISGQLRLPEAEALPEEACA